MSSPIHKYLFSPPSSPPSRASSGKHRPPPLNLSTSISPILDQLSPRLVSHFSPRSSPQPSPRLLPSSSPRPDSSTTATLTAATELIPRSPRTPQNKFTFTLNDTFPTRTPRQSDIESGIYSPQATPRVIVTHPSISTPRSSSIKSSTLILSPQLIPSNVPTQSSNTTTYTISASLPKPLLRLLFLLTLLMASILLLVYIPSTRMPSLKEASQGRRLAYDEDGKAWLDLMRPVKSWGEGLERDYQPAMIKSSKMMKRGIDFLTGGSEVVQQAQVALNADSALRASTPKPTPRPIPKSHELIALQSYLLGSAYNTLPASLDTSLPLDANLILGFKGKLDEMLSEMEGEHDDEVVVWYGGDGIPQIPHALLDHLSSIHGPRHKPTLLPLHSRPDLPTLISLFEKHNLSLSTHPLVMIGNKPVIADEEGLGRMKSLMKEIGWVNEEGKEKEGWKPKFAVVKRREVSEVEKALKEVKK